jgi:NADH-quinone oxidoreductase subunit D
MGRTKNIGYITCEDALALSMTGPTIRAAGIAYDNRKLFPYSSYEEFDFEIPTRTDSDCFARYMIRVAEMRQSLKIVRQAMDKITDDGAIKSDAPGIVPPQREKMKTEMEALIYHFKIITEGFAVPAGEVYQAVESPRGEMGYYVVSDGTAKPYRVHMRAACLANLQTLPKMCEGRLLADVVAAIGSIDIVLGEIDR